MADETLNYGQAYLAMGNGDLVQVTNFNSTLTNNAKQKHTLRRKQAGVSLGVTESQISFDSIIDNKGPERNYWRMVQRGEVKQIRVKLATDSAEVFTYNGVYKDCNTDGPLDDATKVSCVFIGKLEDQ